MSLQQQDGDLGASNSLRKTRFTIDSILDASPPCRQASDDEKTPTSVVVHADCILASATDLDVDSGDASPLPLCSVSDRQRSDDERSRPRIDDVKWERGDDAESAAAAESGRRSGECSSLLARTATAAFQRHQHRVAELRSFNELFLAQYQLCERQLRNHFRHHHPVQQSSTVNVLSAPPPPPPPPPPSGLDYLRHPSHDVERSLWSARDHGSQSPTPTTSTSVRPRATSRPITSSTSVEWSAVSRQSLLLAQSARFVDGRTEHHTTTRQECTASIGVNNGHKRHDQHSFINYSSDRNRTQWPATSNDIGIRFVSCFAHTLAHP